MTTSTADPNPIRRLARSQSPLTVAVEILFALLIVAAFWYSRNADFFAGRVPPGLPVESRVEKPTSSAPGIPSLSRLAGFDPAGKECRQLIANGSFEWTGDWHLPLSPRPAAYTDEQASEGSRSLRLGSGPTDQFAYGDSQARQTLDLPADVESLVLMADVWRTASGSGRDRQYLRVRVGPDHHTLFDERVDLPSWQPVAYDLTLLAGSRVELIFGVLNSGGPGRAAMGVDNVRLYACPEPSKRAALTPSPKSSPPPSLMLPLVYRMAPVSGGEPTATVTPTKTPTAPALCKELVVNGDFESNSGWTIPNTPRPGRYATEPVWSGSRSLGLGIPPGQANAYSDSTAYQWVTLPLGAAQITLRAALWRAVSSGGDFHYLWVAADGKTTRVMQGVEDARYWREISYDLTALAGKRLFLLLGTFNDGAGGVASMFADGVSIQACSSVVTPVPATPTPSPAPTATPTVTPTSIYPPPAEIRSPDFGANAFLWWRREIADRDLTLMQEAGFRWVRQSFAWEDMEPAPGQYTLEVEADRVVRQVNASGLYLLARLDLNADNPDFWAGQPPASNGKFVEFVSMLAQRYNCTRAAVGCVHAWQVGNEPNLAREWGGKRPNPAQYAALLGQVYRAIKAANPNAIVISAGMAPTGTDNEIAMPDTRFYAEMYRAMKGNSDGYFDLLGVHAAGFAAPPETDPAQAAVNPAYGGQRFFAFRHVEDIRKIMQANGDGDKRMAILEFGWTSDPVNPDYYWFGAGAGIDEFVKADYLRRAYVWAGEHWQPWVGLMSVLTMPNLDWLEDGDPFDEEQYWWAILEPSQIDELRLRPAFVGLCIYFRGLAGERCPYDPN
ncbi:MAG: beta-galactosidase [Chloroflexi bacterium]|nr:beta-galactosidase [Chloroflexota bacterium]